MVPKEIYHKLYLNLVHQCITAHSQFVFLLPISRADDVVIDA